MGILRDIFLGTGYTDNSENERAAQRKKSRRQQRGTVFGYHTARIHGMECPTNHTTDAYVEGGKCGGAATRCATVGAWGWK